MQISVVDYTAINMGKTPQG